MEQLRERVRVLWAEAQTWFFRLTQRERVMVGTASTALVTFLLFTIFFSLGSSAASIQRRTTSKLLKLKEAQGLAADYHEAEQQRQSAERALTGTNVSLLSYLEDTGKRAGLEIPTMNPKGDVAMGEDGKIIESSVELTLTDITLTKLVSFLSSVERGPGVLKVRSLRIEPRPSSEVLTAWATVSAYHLKEKP
jgi:general secretion pathway protein M